MLELQALAQSGFEKQLACYAAPEEGSTYPDYSGSWAGR